MIDCRSLCTLSALILLLIIKVVSPENIRALPLSLQRICSFNNYPHSQTKKFNAESKQTLFTETAHSWNCLYFLMLSLQMFLKVHAASYPDELTPSSLYYTDGLSSRCSTIQLLWLYAPTLFASLRKCKEQTYNVIQQDPKVVALPIAMLPNLLTTKD